MVFPSGAQMPHEQFWRKPLELAAAFIPQLRRSADADNDAHETHAERSEDMSGTAGERGPAAPNKRSRGADEDSLRATKKMRRPSEDEYRLTGVGGGKPVKGTPIMMPTNPAQEDDVTSQQHRVQEPATKKRLGGAFKFSNTLGNQQSGKANNHAFKQPARQTYGSKQASAPARSLPSNQHVGDSFRQNHGSAKRRKTSRAPHASAAPEIVDLVSDGSKSEIPQGQVKAVNGKPVQQPSQSSQHSVTEVGSQPSSQIPWFTQTETHKVNSYTAPRPHKSRRRGSSGRRTPSQSSQAQAVPEAGSVSIAGSQQELASVEDLSKSSLPSKPIEFDAGRRKTTPPRINLTEGFDNIKTQKEARDLQKMNEVMSKRLTPNSKQQQRSQQAGKSITAKMQSQQQHPGPLLPRQSADVDTRNKFRRDDETTQQQAQPQPRKLSVVGRMQEKSRGSTVSFMDESPDQLGGATTVGSRARQESPTRQAAQDGTREGSPSNLPPTRFTSRKSEPAPARQAKFSDSEEEKDRISLVAIYSRGCVLDTKVRTDEKQRIDLVWEEDEKQYQVLINSKPYKIHGVMEAMVFGSSEASTWQHCNSSNKVILKGPTSDRSNGNILLLFRDEHGKSDCYNQLLSACNDTLKSARLDNERMERTFDHLAMEVKTDSLKAKAKARDQLETALRYVQEMPARAERERAVSEEQILYEQPDNGPSTFSNTQSKPERALSQATTSGYFADSQVTRKSTRQSKPVRVKSPSPPPIERWTEVHKPTPWNQSVMYPPTGAKRVTVDFQDLERLDEGEFLNDNIVGYALRRIEENMAPEHKDKVHFFNSYFFTSLTNKNGRRAFNYDAVKKWTKQKDLINVPYIVVPINENLHWYVAIICNLPQLDRKPVDLDVGDFDAAATPSKSQQTSARQSPIRNPEIPDSQEANKPDKPDVEQMRNLQLSDGETAQAKGSETPAVDEDGEAADNAQGSQQTEKSAPPPPAGSGKKSKKRAPPPPRKYPLDRPTIITLDSFGVGHPPQVGFLKDYVLAEAKDKRGMEVDRDAIQGMKAVGIPEQSNFCDCGLYLIGYVEEFAKDPQAFVTEVLSRKLDQRAEFQSFSPSTKRDELRDDVLRLHREQNAERQAQKKAKRLEKDRVAAAASSTTQTSATPADAAGSQPSPPGSQVPTAPQSRVASPVKAPSTKASRAPSAEQDDLRVPAPDTSTEARGQVQPCENDRSYDEEHDELLESSVPRPLIDRIGSESTRKRKASEQPNTVDEGAATNTEDDADEMLDHADREEAGYREDVAGRNFHKVRSPELDALSGILGGGPFPAALSNSDQMPATPS